MAHKSKEAHDIIETLRSYGYSLCMGKDRAVIAICGSLGTIAINENR